VLLLVLFFVLLLVLLSVLLFVLVFVCTCLRAWVVILGSSIMTKRYAHTVAVGRSCLVLRTSCLVTNQQDERFVIGNYTYLDGGLHVQLSMACDAIISKLAEHRGQKTMACFLCTPTDDHVVPAAAAEAVKVMSLERALLFVLSVLLWPASPRPSCSQSPSRLPAVVVCASVCLQHTLCAGQPEESTVVAEAGHGAFSGQAPSGLQQADRG
jgi:hypothetical protein